MYFSPDYHFVWYTRKLPALVMILWLITLLFTITSNWRRKWQPTPVLLPGESHGQRNLAGYSPRGRKESDRIGQLSVQAPWFLSLFLKVSTVGKQFCAPALGLVALCLLLAAEAFAVNHWSHILESSQEKFQESAWGNSALGARVARWLHLFLCHSLKFQICGKPPLKKTKTLPFFFLFPDCKNCVFVLKKKKQLNIKKCLI